jgi:hypothetical protein
MDASLVISVISLIIAGASFVYSAFNIERDRAKVKAWAEVISHSCHDNEGSRANILRLTVANVGRRPIIIKGFKVQAKGLSFDVPAKDPDFDVVYEFGPGCDNESAMNSLRSDFSTKNTCVALKEGDFFENEIAEEDSHNDMVTMINGTLYEGEAIYVQDIQGNLYPVESCEEKIALFYGQT